MARARPSLPLYQHGQCERDQHRDGDGEAVACVDPGEESGTSPRPPAGAFTSAAGRGGHCHHPLVERLYDTVVNLYAALRIAQRAFKPRHLQVGVTREQGAIVKIHSSSDMNLLICLRGTRSRTMTSPYSICQGPCPVLVHFESGHVMRWDLGTGCSLPAVRRRAAASSLGSNRRPLSTAAS